MGFKQKYNYTDFINKKFGMLTITGVTKKKSVIILIVIANVVIQKT